MLSSLRPAKINFYLRYMAERGISRDQVLLGTGIRICELKDNSYLIDIDKYIRIISNMKQLSKSRELAFDLGRSLTLGDLGVLGYCVMSSDDTKQATKIWHTYNPIFFGNLIEINYSHQNNRLVAEYIPQIDMREDLLRFLIEEKLNYDLALHRLVGLSEYPIESLSVSYPSPPNQTIYQETFGVPVQFSTDRNILTLKKHAYSISLKGANTEIHEHCMMLLKNIYNSVQSQTMLSHRVRDILYKQLENTPNITELAEQLSCSKRTLNRKLQNEGITFTDLVTETRLKALKNFLSTTDLCAIELSYKLGFSDVSNMRRFFKSHTGKTIQEFRANIISGDLHN